MAIHRLPGDHLQMTCDTPGCTMQGPVKRGVSEEELLTAAEQAGWNVEREFGLHYCGLTTVHDCEVCGAPTRSSVRDESTGAIAYYCDEHFDVGLER